MIPHRDRGFRLPPEIGHVRSESPVTLQRNDRSRSIGIVGHVAPETVVILVRNTHTAQLKWWRDNAGHVTLDKLTPQAIAGLKSELLARKTGNGALIA
jgi:hypothetical protein